jgi:hypothetical protein
MTGAEKNTSKAIDVIRLASDRANVVESRCAELEAANAELRAEVEKLKIPFCIGLTTIRNLVETGQAEFENHAPLIAADDLYQNFYCTKIAQAAGERK